MLSQRASLSDAGLQQNQRELDREERQDTDQARVGIDAAVDRSNDRVDDQFADPGLSGGNQRARQRLNAHRDRGAFVRCPDQLKCGGDIARRMLDAFRSFAPTFAYWYFLYLDCHSLSPHKIQRSILSSVARVTTSPRCRRIR